MILAIALIALVSVPSASPVGSETLRIEEGITPPERIVFVQPVYPEEARKAGRTGDVVLDLVIDEKGNVSAATPRPPGSEFDQAAVDAALQWKYRPATKDGKPVKVNMEVTVRFRLE